MTEKEIKDLEKRLTIALTSESAKSTAMRTLGLNFQNVIYADSKAVGSNLDGSSAKPFNKLQKAIDKAKTFPVKDRVLILVSSGSSFDEDIVIPGGRMLSILGLGAWTIGNASGNNFASSSPRNVTWQINETTPTTFWETLIMGTLTNDETSSTHAVNAVGLDISGNFIVTGNGTSTQSLELHLHNVKVTGNYDTTGTSKGVQSYFRKCLFDSGFNSPSGALNIVESTQFDTTIICSQYCRMWQCEIKGGMTTSGIALALPPAGLFQCTFSGVFTGPASSLHLDTITNHYFITNGASLAGGATKVLLHNETL